jgi:demethylmenaquinone methyltransferase/2-methoxy-6-polyprenyl-1,4-benzoquinol methylase
VSVSTSKEPARIAGMFDAIAWRYDRLNHLLSAGLDKRWRRRAVRELRLKKGDRVIDVCSGTADLAIESAGREAVRRPWSGWTSPERCSRSGSTRIRRAGLASRVSLARGDAMALPFADAAFDAGTIAFGIRNVADPLRGCRELCRVLRPGGRIAILEFGMPETPVLAALYAWYFRHVLPRIGRLISRHSDAYEYLPASVAAFPSGTAFVTILQQAGFRDVRCVRLAVGAVYLYLAARGPQDK